MSERNDNTETWDHSDSNPSSRAANQSAPSSSDPFYRPVSLPNTQPVQVGKYRVLRSIGEGGMGVVYLAKSTEDSEERLVAIKVAQTSRLGEQAAARLKRERKVLFALNHPNIARIFDGGTLDDGRPYFVMEYIEGRRIDRYCDQNRLSTKERVHLFQKVCDAVSYCHSHLIVHRDIKPANILVDRDGEPKLLDFGIAKLLNPDLMQDGDVTVDPRGPMTIAYASPEQVAGGLITPSSDIYSLGVLLYQLLTGRLPYQLPDRWRQEVVEIICNETPELPSTAIRKSTTLHDADTNTDKTLSPQEVASLRSGDPGSLKRQLAGDLDDILLVALAKKPTLRYDSALDLKRDLDNHLESRVVEARKKTKRVNWRLYAFNRFLVQHKLSVTAGLAAFTSLSIGLTAAMYQRCEAVNQRDRAQQIASELQQLSGGVVDSFSSVSARLPAGRIAVERLFESAISVLEAAAKRDDISDDGRLLLAGRFIDLARLAAGTREAGVGDTSIASALLDRGEEVLRPVAGDLTLGERARVSLLRGDIARITEDSVAAAEHFQRSEELIAMYSDELPLAMLITQVEANTGKAIALHQIDAQSNARRSMDAATQALRLAEDLDQKHGTGDTRRLLADTEYTLGELLLASAQREQNYADLQTAQARFVAAYQLRQEVLRRTPWDARSRGELLAVSIKILQVQAENVSRNSGEVSLEQVANLLDASWTQVDFLLNADGQDNEAVRRLGALIISEIDLMFLGVDVPYPRRGQQTGSPIIQRLTWIQSQSQRYRHAVSHLSADDNLVLTKLAVRIDIKLIELTVIRFGEVRASGEKAKEAAAAIGRNAIQSAFTSLDKFIGAVTQPESARESRLTEHFNRIVFPLLYQTASLAFEESNWFKRELAGSDQLDPAWRPVLKAWHRYTVEALELNLFADEMQPATFRSFATLLGDRL